MKNNKGFSLIELLAVIAILGILFGIGLQAYSRYKEKAKQQGYDTMAKSATEAMEEYKMDHPAATTLEFDKLYGNGYLSSLADPGSKGNTCTGKVTVSTVAGTGDRQLDQNEYTVVVCCANYHYTYNFPSGNRYSTPEACSVTPSNSEKVIQIATPGKTKSNLELCDDIKIGTELFRITTIYDNEVYAIGHYNIDLYGGGGQSTSADNTIFSTDLYWEQGSYIDLKYSRDGYSYSNYIQEPLDKYEQFLISKGLTNFELSIPIVEELDGACINAGGTQGYWTKVPSRSQYSDGYINGVTPDGEYVQERYISGSVFGVRPLIKVSLDDIA